MTFLGGTEEFLQGIKESRNFLFLKEHHGLEGTDAQIESWTLLIGAKGIPCAPP